MRFGGRQLPIALRVGRMLIYIQAFFLVYIALFALLVDLVAGNNGSAAVESKNFTQSQSVTFSVFNILLALVVIALAVQTSRFSVNARWGLVAGEIFIAVYYIGFLASPTSVSAWIVGPLFSAMIITCHFWPSVQVAFAESAAKTSNNPSSTAGTTELMPAVAQALAEQKAAQEAQLAERPAPSDDVMSDDQSPSKD